MRTEVLIRAIPGRSAQVRAAGGLAVRQTGPTTVHLIGTAHTPLGGDEIGIRIEVAAGAVLHVRTVAATIALPARDIIDSTSRWDISVADGGRLLLEPEPMIVAGGARHSSTTVIDAGADSTVVVHEHAQLGRATEDPAHASRARWDGALHIDIGGVAALRHRVALTGGHLGDRIPGNAVSSVFSYPDTRPEAVSPNATAARLRLTADATLTTAIADTASAARRLCEDLEFVALSEL